MVQVHHDEEVANRIDPRVMRSCLRGHRRLEIGPSFCLPPVESCRGTSPIQAAKLRPDRKTVGSATVAAIALAPMTPMPGMVYATIESNSLTPLSPCAGTMPSSARCARNALIDSV